MIVSRGYMHFKRNVDPLTFGAMLFVKLHFHVIYDTDHSHYNRYTKSINTHDVATYKIDTCI